MFVTVKRAGPAGDFEKEGNSHTVIRRQRLHLHLARRFNHLLFPNIAGSQSVVSEIIKHITNWRQETWGLIDQSLSFLFLPSYFFSPFSAWKKKKKTLERICFDQKILAQHSRKYDAKQFWKPGINGQFSFLFASPSQEHLGDNHLAAKISLPGLQGKELWKADQKREEYSKRSRLKPLMLVLQVLPQK